MPSRIRFGIRTLLKAVTLAGLFFGLLRFAAGSTIFLACVPPLVAGLTIVCFYDRRWSLIKVAAICSIATGLFATIVCSALVYRFVLDTDGAFAFWKDTVPFAFKMILTESVVGLHSGVCLGIVLAYFFKRDTQDDPAGQKAKSHPATESSARKEAPG